MRTLFVNTAEKHPIFVWLLLLIIMVLLSGAGYFLSTQLPSIPGDIIIQLTLIPLALIIILAIALPWSIGQLGLSETGASGFLFGMVIQWLLIIGGLAFERWHSGNTLSIAFGNMLAITALLNIPLPLLLTALFGLSIIPILIFRGWKEAKIIIKTTTRLLIAVILLCPIALMGYWIANGHMPQ